MITKERMKSFLKANNWSPLWVDTYWSHNDDRCDMNGLPLELAFKRVICKIPYDEIIKMFTPEEIKFIQDIK